MDVQIVEFPETKVAAIEHLGPPALEHETVRKLIAWKLENRLLDPLRYRSYGIHYTDPRITPPFEHRVEFCISVEEDVGPNPFGITTKMIPRCRCARVRDIGSRFYNRAAVYLGEIWLPESGETLGDFPIFFHYVNVGPNVWEEEMITDVYLPLGSRKVEKALVD
ncbi:MAG: GyrI-like domain-containing protein [Acidobacteriaceae bacterium]|nr:GyrI-like domain-containing protein [Acidobacteriaceae bacterium]